MKAGVTLSPIEERVHTDKQLAKLAEQRFQEHLPKEGQKGFQSVSSPIGEDIKSTDRRLAKEAGIGTATLYKTEKVLESCCCCCGPGGWGISCLYFIMSPTM